jgi:transposase-like protein
MIGSEMVWHWVAVEVPANKEILSISISKERNLFVVAEHLLYRLLEKHGSILFRLMVEHDIPKYLIF